MNKETNLTIERLMELFTYNPETGIFTRNTHVNRNYPIGSIAGNMHWKGYLRIVIDQEHYLAHRLAWFYYYKVWPSYPRYQIHHKDEIKHHNWISNLEDVTNSENMILMHYGPPTVK